MKVAFLSNDPASTVRFRGALIRDLVSLGHEVVSIGPRHTIADQDDLRGMGAEWADWNIERKIGSGLIKHAFVLIKILRKEAPDTLMASFIQPIILSSFSGAIARIPHRVALFEGLGFSFSDSPVGLRHAMTRVIIRRFLKVGLWFFHRAVFLNECDKEELCQRKIVSRAKSQVVPGIGIDIDEYFPKPSEENGRPLRVLMAARLVREKGVVEYCHAAKQFRERSGVEFFLAGGLDQNPSALSRDEVQALCEECGVEWIGHVSNMREEYQSSDIFVLPSYYREGMPRTILEAMACGLPVITTDNVGCRDAVSDGQEGFLVSIKNASELAEKLSLVLDQPELRASLGERARNRAEVDFSSTRINGIFISILVRDDGHGKPPLA